MLCYIFVNIICRLPSNISDPMGDHMPPLNAWRPIHPQNTGPSFNAGFHGMGPPSVPRTGDMALPINAVSINLMILKDVTLSLMIVVFLYKTLPTKMLLPICFMPKCYFSILTAALVLHSLWICCCIVISTARLIFKFGQVDHEQYYVLLSILLMIKKKVWMSIFDIMCVPANTVIIKSFKYLYTF